MRSFNFGFKSKKNFLHNYQKGTLSYKYKDTKCIKSPIDIAIYLRLLYLLKPQTIIEIGSKEGGSALLFSDIISLYNIDCHIWSLDIDSQPTLESPNITFLKGDVYNLQASLTDQLWSSFSGPILVVEDSEHTFQACLACLNYFKEKLNPGDFLVIEDGILSELGLDAKYQGGPNRAISEFMSHNNNIFEIATEYCDMFGVNVTYNPNAYLRKI